MDALQTLEVPITSETLEEEITVTSPLSVAPAQVGAGPGGASLVSLLEGVRVLDLSRVIAGPYCAAFLGDLGADVVKVERPPAGDDLRVLRGRNGMSASFAAINRNKRGIALDLQRPEGARIAFDLARRADVVVENFLPGVAARLGLGYAPGRAQAGLQHHRAGDERPHGPDRDAGRPAHPRRRLRVRRRRLLHGLRHGQ